MSLIALGAVRRASLLALTVSLMAAAPVLAQVNGHPSTRRTHHAKRVKRTCRGSRRHRRARSCSTHHRYASVSASRHHKGTSSPTAPSNLGATAGDQQVSLSWGASTDSNNNVAGYTVYRGGSKVGQTTGTSYTDTGLTDGTTYSYDVVAYDTSGNLSSPSNTVSATPVDTVPPSAPTVSSDTTPPTVPSYLDGVPGNSQVSLSWQGSTDNVGVAGYDVYRNGGLVAETASTSYTDAGLSNGTSYSYSVSAYDAAGNVSSPSSSISVIPTSLNPSGQQLTFGDVPGWHQVFADNFVNDSLSVGSFAGCSWPNGALVTLISCAGLSSLPTVDNNWFAYPDGWTDSRYGTYYPSRVLSIGNGMMDYYIHTESINGTTYHMTSAVVPKIPGGTGSLGGQLYGRYVIRARFDSLPGYHVAFLLWPDSNNWPADGEIDFPDDPFDATTIDAFVHYGTSSSSQFDHFGVAGSLNQWHTYEIDWLATGLSFYLDGKLVGTELAHIPADAMHWVLQTDTWGGEAVPSSTTAGHVQVAYATAYAPGP